MLADPAILISTPNTKMRLGINNSPPATPSMLLTSPTPAPIKRPAATRVGGLAGSSATGCQAVRVSTSNSAPIAASSSAMTWTRRRALNFFTRPAPQNALTMPPAASPRTSGRCGTIAASGTKKPRAIMATANVMRLTVRLSGIAERASKPRECISIGRRNSPPPSPIRPPSPPIGTHQPNALRKNGQDRVRCMDRQDVAVPAVIHPRHFRASGNPGRQHRRVDRGAPLHTSRFIPARKIRRSGLR